MSAIIGPRPRWLPPWPDTSGITDPSREPRRHRITESAEGMAVPVVLGRAKVTGKVFVTAAGSSGSLVVAWAISAGPIQGYVSHTLGGMTSSEYTGVTLQWFTGTAAQAASSLLTAAISGYVQRHPGLAYVVAKIASSSNLWGGIPDLAVVLDGRNDIYDPRTATTGFSANPALIAAHLMTAADLGRVDTARVDWNDIEETADWWDTLVGGTARYSVGVVLDTRKRLKEALSSLLAQCRGFEIWWQGKWSVRCDRSSAAVAAIDEHWLAAKESGASGGELDGDVVSGYEGTIADWSESTVSADEIPDVVRIRYPDASRNWEWHEQRYPVEALVGGANREADISAPYVTSAAVAARLAEEMYAERHASWRMTLGCLRPKVSLRRGDVVTVQEIGGLSPTSMRVCSVSPSADGRCEIVVAPTYAFSAAVGTVDTKPVVPVPRVDDGVSAPTSLSVTVLTDTSGEYVTYTLYVTWDRSTSPNVNSYDVQLKVGAGSFRTVGTTSREVTSCYVPVSEPGVVHYVDVYAVSPTGGYSSAASASETPGGSNSVSVTKSYFYRWRRFEPFQPGPGVDTAKACYGAWGGTLAWSKSDSGSQTKRIEVRRNGNTVARLTASATSAYFGTGDFSGTLDDDASDGNFIMSGWASGDSWTVVAVLKDGRESSVDMGSPTSPTDFPSANSNEHNDLDLVCLHHDGANRAGSYQAAVNMGPADGDVGYFNSGKWNYVCMFGGTVAFGSSDTEVTWNHGKNFATPIILLGPKENKTYWWEYVDANNVKIKRASSGAAADCSVFGLFRTASGW